MQRSDKDGDNRWLSYDKGKGGDSKESGQETYIAARNAAKGFEELSSAYETESGYQMGRGKRRKRLMNLFTSDDDSSDSENKKQNKKSKIPAAPLPPSPSLTGISSLMKSSSIASKNNNVEVTIIPNMKQSKTTASPVSTTVAIKRNKFVQQIINHREQAAEKTLQRKKAMSLENIHKLSVKNKAVDSTLCCKVPVKVLEASENCKSTPQSSSNLSLLNSQSVEQLLSDSSEKSNNRRDFEPPSEDLLQTASTSISSTDIAKFSNLYE
ncbi:PREDICTED: uncharacterized protein LOC105449548 [Wasmannia auropunctata]|uniref:uncharacterized protein LOC105449548 n=1 Tax=Wasmannia auropunctata TaxID=64793 RepID=UPI0005EEB976|nr:PREDICTED: uncharacterized protein LOC105449548 [Wasmannia auropunctata]